MTGGCKMKTIFWNIHGNISYILADEDIKIYNKINERNLE